MSTTAIEAFPTPDERFAGLPVGPQVTISRAARFPPEDKGGQTAPEIPTFLARSALRD